MDRVDYLGALKRRAALIAAAVVLALAIALALSALEEPDPPSGSRSLPAGTNFSATAILLRTSTGSTTVGGLSAASLDAIAKLATVGEVPLRVADELGTDESPLSLAQRVVVTANSDTGLLDIAATSESPREAERLANTFTTQLLDYLADETKQRAQRSARAVSQRLESLTEEIGELEREIDSTPEEERDLLSAERDSKLRAYVALFDRFQALSTAGTEPIGLERIQKARGVVVPTEPGVIQVVPEGRTSRIVFAGILGLLLGCGIALFLERFDDRLQTKTDAEEHFALPVLAEIPAMSRSLTRKNRIAVAGAPKSPPADAFQLLAAGLAHGGRSGNGSTRTSGSDLWLGTVLVTSPGPGDGKTTVVANLAATFAELGRKVIIVSCDFRRPRIHEMFEVSNQQGLSDALKNGARAPILNGHSRATKISRVALIPSGGPAENPAELLGSERMAVLLAEARRMAHIVILDTPPLLAASDATLLLPEVDAVLLVGRVGRTTTDQAARTTELLQRFGAPVIGVALNDAPGVDLPRDAYRYVESRKGFSRLARHSKRT